MPNMLEHERDTMIYLWGNPEKMRIIDGFYITSWDKLLEFLRYKAGKGYREVGVYEAPRFILLGGG